LQDKQDFKRIRNRRKRVKYLEVVPSYGKLVSKLSQAELMDVHNATQFPLNSPKACVAFGASGLGENEVSRLIVLEIREGLKIGVMPLQEG
jgi:hypothetical protein